MDDLRTLAEILADPHPTDRGAANRLLVDLLLPELSDKSLEKVWKNASQDCEHVVYFGQGVCVMQNATMSETSAPTMSDQEIIRKVWSLVRKFPRGMSVPREFFRARFNDLEDAWYVERLVAQVGAGPAKLITGEIVEHPIPTGMWEGSGKCADQEQAQRIAEILNTIGIVDASQPHPRTVAALPDLLSALQMIVAGYEAVPVPGMETDITAARAAIAKAQGGAA